MPPCTIDLEQMVTSALPLEELEQHRFFAKSNLTVETRYVGAALLNGWPSQPSLDAHVTVRNGEVPCSG